MNTLRARACRLALVGAGAALLLSATFPAGAALPAWGQGFPTLAPLIEQTTPAVVNIAVASRQAAELNPLLRDPFFRRFFNLPDQMPEARPQMSAGSGVIVDAAKGYVMTNHHVIDKASEVTVTLKDKRQFKAKVLGSDPGTDIALLQIDPDKLTVMPMGDSEALKVGDFVVAIGNPFGLGQTVTSGIVSALSRTGLNLEGYEDFIQTDASINPGNSGGALVNLKGELIGINTAIIGPSGGNVGIGFAVPVNMARSVMEQLVQYGEVRRGRLGIVIQDLTPDVAKAIGVEVTAGAVVTQVEKGSPAERAGVQAGDVVTGLNGQPIRGFSDLRNQVGLMPIGATVRLDILRKGEKKTLSAKVERFQGETRAAIEASPKLAGAEFQDGREGVLVAEVAQGSPAARAGLRRGDVITGVNRKPVGNVKELEGALKDGGKVLALNLRRGDSNMFLLIQ
ncbi:MAG: DegQ family serine endoprotease [Alphaproteobacteria bacterium]|nr:DegQ family serine endoprotease [Alphaproteobacteria bacterium]